MFIATVYQYHHSINMVVALTLSAVSLVFFSLQLRTNAMFSVYSGAACVSVPTAATALSNTLHRSKCLRSLRLSVDRLMNSMYIIHSSTLAHCDTQTRAV
jgi:hypothetical protein